MRGQRCAALYTQERSEHVLGVPGRGRRSRWAGDLSAPHRASVGVGVGEPHVAAAAAMAAMAGDGGREGDGSQRQSQKSQSKKKGLKQKKKTLGSARPESFA